MATLPDIKEPPMIATPAAALPATLTVTAWHDQLVEAHGFGPRHPYVEGIGGDAYSSAAYSGCQRWSDELGDGEQVRVDIFRKIVLDDDVRVLASDDLEDVCRDVVERPTPNGLLPETGAAPGRTCGSRTSPACALRVLTP
jgi:hypothetical protein